MAISVTLYNEYILIADLKKSGITLSKGEAIQLIKIINDCTFQFKALSTDALFFMFENELEGLIESKPLTDEDLENSIAFWCFAQEKSFSNK